MKTIARDYQKANDSKLLDILQPKPTIGVPINRTLFFQQLHPVVYGKKGERAEMVKVTYIGTDCASNIALLAKLAGKKKDLWYTLATYPDTELGKKIAQIPGRLSLKEIMGRLEQIVLRH